jgi:hypothetical protein
MNSTGIQLDRSVVAAGRVKAPPRSVAADRLEFEVHDAAGRTIYAGSLDHPLHVVSEYEDPAQPGALRRRARELDQEVFQIRLPGELAAREIAFFEVRAGSNPWRATLGVLPLP